MKKILGAGEFTTENIIKTSVFLSKAGDFQKLNELYSRHISTNPPASTTVVTGFANNEILVEIDVIASKYSNAYYRQIDLGQ